ncbi:MAG: HAMP domain-containing histidine kinase, partial [Moraxellaceae bacterium]
EQQFTGDVSHELRTPLAVLRGNVQLCQSRYGQDKALSRLLNTVDDMQLLVDTLLALARKKTQDIPQQQVQLSQLLQQLVDDVQTLAQARHMQIRLALHSDATKQLNPAIASMVFNNVIRNALNYSEGQHLDIVLEAQRVIIVDDGIGLTSEVRDLLSNPALINDEAQQYSPKGHGIGLQLVQRLCATLNWRVELYDRAQIDNLSFITGTKGLAVVIYLNS